MTKRPMINMLGEELLNEFLRTSGVWNDLAHCEHDELCTAITSIDELTAFANLVYGHAYYEAEEDNAHSKR